MLPSLLLLSTSHARMTRIANLRLRATPAVAIDRAQPRAHAETHSQAAHHHTTHTATHNTTHSYQPSQPNAHTIFALSSGAGVRAGGSPIRVSGPAAAQALRALAPHAKTPPPRTAVVRKLRAPSTRELLDEALVLYMPGPKTFTGEDTLELHTHGSRAVAPIDFTQTSS